MVKTSLWWPKEEAEEGELIQKFTRKVCYNWKKIIIGQNSLRTQLIWNVFNWNRVEPERYIQMKKLSYTIIPNW